MYEESSEELFENAPVGYLTTLADGTIVRVNQTFLDWTGYDRRSLLAGMRLIELLTVPGRIYYDTTLMSALQIQGFVREVTFDVICPVRPVLPVLTNIQRRAPQGACPTLFRVTFFNATDRRQYERDLLLARRAAEEAALTEQAAREAAESASRAKDDFLALVSHELRTPLSAIVGWTHILQRGGAAPANLEQGLQVIERNAKVQVQLVDDLLDSGRILSGKLRLDVQRVELASVLEAAVATAALAAEAKQIGIQMILDPSIVVSGDPGRLQQIFWNLLSNAVKFTPKSGSIRIVMARINSHVDVTMTDNGQGMSREFLARAFDRFRQEDSVTGRASTGLGLGLSIVKQLVEMHGGAITARSEGAGLGSTFIVELPVSIVLPDAERVYPRDALVSSITAAHVTNLHNIRIVMVEDQDDARELLVGVLRSVGAELIAVASAQEGVAAVELHQPHVLISDIGLPDFDGYELIRRVRMLGGGIGAVPAIALTAFSRLDDRTRAMLSGFQMHLAKPVDARELTLAVASLAGRLSARS